MVFWVRVDGDMCMVTRGGVRGQEEVVGWLCMVVCMIANDKEAKMLRRLGTWIQAKGRREALLRMV